MCFQVFLQGRQNLNRAVSEDIVAVEILPREQWSCPSSLLVEDVEERPSSTTDQDTVWRVSFIWMCGKPKFCSD